MVASHLQLFERRSRDAPDQDAPHSIDFAGDGAECMKALINALPAYSRVQTRAVEPEMTEFGGVFAPILRDIQLRVRKLEAGVTVDDLPSPPMDRHQIVSVFANLIGNVLAFHGDHPPEIPIPVERTADG
jgi:light-regulated signal transduction histidine kinase (bacteriophytochrome)